MLIRPPGRSTLLASGSTLIPLRFFRPAGVTDPNIANNTATDTDTLVAQADLKVTITDGKTKTIAGTKDTYTITVSNAGPSTATGPLIAIVFQIRLPGCGSGNISDIVALPSGSNIVTKLPGQSAHQRPDLSDTATVTAASGATDPIPSNNSATDTDTL